MLAFGTIVNCLAILVGGLLGLILGQRLKERYKTIATQALSLGVLAIGVKMALQGENLALILLSVVLGAVLGEWLNIESWLEKLGARLKRLAKSSSTRFVEGFVATSVLFCVGPMAILGAIEDGMRGDASVLLIKSVMDGITDLSFAATMGVGALFSVLPVLLYQGGITLFSSWLADFFSQTAINNLSGAGGLLILGLGLNMLGITKIRVANLLPALLFAILFSFFF